MTVHKFSNVIDRQHRLLALQETWSVVCWMEVWSWFEPFTYLPSRSTWTFSLFILCQLLTASSSAADRFTLQLAECPVHLLKTLKGVFCIDITHQWGITKQLFLTPWEWERARVHYYEWHLSYKQEILFIAALGNQTLTP